MKSLIRRNIIRGSRDRRQLQPGDEYYEPHRRYGVRTSGECPACVRVYDPLNILPQHEDRLPGYLYEIGPYDSYYD